MEEAWIEERQLLVYKCDTPLSCRHAIRVDDPFVGNWAKALEKIGKIPCNVCGGPTRYFATMVGYMKAVCWKGGKVGCGKMEMKEPDRGTTTYTPEAPPLPGGDA